MLQFNPDNEKKFLDVLSRYPVKKAALLPVLYIAQDQWGFLNEENMTYVAQRLELHASEVMNTATFYTMYNKGPIGKYHVQVCTNLSCYLRGADKVMKYCERKLGIQCGETRSDGQFTLGHAECLASCGTAPMMQVGDNYFEDLTPGKLDALFDKWEADK